MFGQAANELITLREAVDRLDRLIPKSDTWPTQFASEMIKAAGAAGSISLDYALAFLEDVGRFRPEPVNRVKGAHQAMADVMTALVPHSKTVGVVLAAESPLVTSSGMRQAIIATFKTAIGTWQVVVESEKERAKYDPRSGEYLRTRDRLAKQIWELGQALLKKEIPIAKFPGAIPPPAPSGLPVARIRTASFLVGATLVALAVGLAGLAIWRAKKLG